MPKEYRANDNLQLHGYISNCMAVYQLKGNDDELGQQCKVLNNYCYQQYFQYFASINNKIQLKIIVANKNE